jgi:hypothetical protein
MALAMRVAGNNEGKGGKAMAMATRVADELMAMATKTREAGKEEVNGKGNKSNGNGKEDSNHEQQQQQ